DISPQPSPPSRRPLGRVTAINGAQAALAVEAGVATAGESAQITVGRFMGIMTGHSTVIGLITEVSEQQTNSQPATYRSIARLDLISEILTNGAAATFQRGVSDYPTIGDSAMLVDQRELRLIYGGADQDRAYIGNLH